MGDAITPTTGLKPRYFLHIAPFYKCTLHPSINGWSDSYILAKAALKGRGLKPSFLGHGREVVGGRWGISRGRRWCWWPGAGGQMRGVAGGAGGQLTYAPVTTYILEQGPNPHIPLVPSAIQQGEIPSNSLVWSLNREKCFPSPAVDWAVVLHFPFPRPDVGVLY